MYQQLLLSLILLKLLLKQSLSYFQITNQIYDKSIEQTIRNMEMVSNNLKSATKKSLFLHLRLLRNKVFMGHLHKITLTINRGSFITLGNIECLQTLAEHTNAKLNIL